jgi:hypothetical protein
VDFAKPEDKDVKTSETEWKEPATMPYTMEKRQMPTVRIGTKATLNGEGQRLPEALSNMARGMTVTLKSAMI